MSNVEITIDVMPITWEKQGFVYPSGHKTIHESIHGTSHETSINRNSQQKATICPGGTKKLEETILLLPAIIIDSDAEACLMDLRSAKEQLITLLCQANPRLPHQTDPQPLVQGGDYDND